MKLPTAEYGTDEILLHVSRVAEHLILFRLVICPIFSSSVIFSNSSFTWGSKDASPFGDDAQDEKSKESRNKQIVAAPMKAFFIASLLCMIASIFPHSA